MKALNIVTLSSVITIHLVLASSAKAAAAVPTTDEQFEIMQSAMTQIKPNLSAVDFSREVESKYLATHRFLAKLNRSQQREVYSYYRKETDFNQIRSKIFDLFFTI